MRIESEFIGLLIVRRKHVMLIAYRERDRASDTLLSICSVIRIIMFTFLTWLVLAILCFDLSFPAKPFCEENLFKCK